MRVRIKPSTGTAPKVPPGLHDGPFGILCERPFADSPNSLILKECIIRIHTDGDSVFRVFGMFAVVPIMGQWPERGLRMDKKERYAKIHFLNDASFSFSAGPFMQYHF